LIDDFNDQGFGRQALVDWWQITGGDQRREHGRFIVHRFCGRFSNLLLSRLFHFLLSRLFNLFLGGFFHHLFCRLLYFLFCRLLYFLDGRLFWYLGSRLFRATRY
jgi:hypothetical protein